VLVVLPMRLDPAHRALAGAADRGRLGPREVQRGTVDLAEAGLAIERLTGGRGLIGFGGHCGLLCAV